jgi:hypothetical protein
MRVDTRSTKGAVVLTTLMVLPSSAMEKEPSLLRGTPTGITPLRGILVMGLTKHSGQWRELDDSSTRWGNVTPSFKAKTKCIHLCVTGSSFTHKATNSEINSITSVYYIES